MKEPVTIHIAGASDADRSALVLTIKPKLIDLGYTDVKVDGEAGSTRITACVPVVAKSEQTAYAWPEVGQEFLEKGGTRKFIVGEVDERKGVIRGKVDGGAGYSCAPDVFEKVWR